MQFTWSWNCDERNNDSQQIKESNATTNKMKDWLLTFDQDEQFNGVIR